MYSICNVFLFQLIIRILLHISTITLFKGAGGCEKKLFTEKYSFVGWATRSTQRLTQLFILNLHDYLKHVVNHFNFSEPMAISEIKLQQIQFVLISYCRSPHPSTQPTKTQRKNTANLYCHSSHILAFRQEEIQSFDVLLAVVHDLPTTHN